MDTAMTIATRIIIVVPCFLWFVLGQIDSAATMTSPAPALVENSPEMEAQPPLFFPVAPNSPPGVLIPIVSPSPMIPILPNPMSPKLSGRCPLNFSTLTQTMDRTAQDCLAPLALYVGEVICCPQFKTLLYMAQGHHSNATGLSALSNETAEYCFSDLSNLLVGKGANNTLPQLCSLEPKILTGGFCPVTDAKDLFRLINTTSLLAACSSVDPLRECCRPVCQPAIQEAAFQLISNGSSSLGKPNEILPSIANSGALEDCKEVVLAWMASQLSIPQANTALRNLLSCKVNQACPLVFEDASFVIEDCKGFNPVNTTCCTSLRKYISGVQQQKLINNLQALQCVSVLGSTLQNNNVTQNIYELCDIHLKDFSLQGSGDQGCLLNSLPSDVMINNSSGITFTCDLNDNIAAPWLPMSTMSLCSGNVPIPKIPQSATPLAASGDCGRGIIVLLTMIVQVLLFLLLL